MSGMESKGRKNRPIGAKDLPEGSGALRSSLDTKAPPAWDWTWPTMRARNLSQIDGDWE